MALIILGIVLNGFLIVHDQPAFSLEEDPTQKLAAERNANYHFFQLQRARLLKRQKRVGQYGWVVLMVVIASSWFLYSNAVRATTLSKQISAIQTFAVADSKDAVLSLTLGDGSNVKYLVKAESPVTHTPKSDERSVDTLQNWQLASLGTAINVGASTVPLGIALRIAN
jgi:hypothetical protein